MKGSNPGTLARIGVLMAFCCALALYLEASGLGVPRDTGMRTGYTSLLVLGTVASIVVPIGAWLRMARTPRKH